MHLNGLVPRLSFGARRFYDASRPEGIASVPISHLEKHPAMRILGIVTHTHDSGIALIRDGIPEIVIEEERLNRQKKTMKFPKQALAAALTDRGLSLDDLDTITMPWHVPTLIKTL